jgi:hypothetical protein
VQIDGDSQVPIHGAHGKAWRVYRAVPIDLRNPQYNWGPLGATDNKVLVEFETGGHPPGTTLTKQLAVRVTDADGLQAQAEKTVTVKVIGFVPT